MLTLQPTVLTYVCKLGKNHKLMNEMVRPERFELPTYWFVASRSIQLSYGRMSETIDRISRFR